MKFGIKTLKKQIKGACHFTEDGGYLSCFHYTPEQLAYFDGKDRGWGMRAHFSSGVRMEFKTDATVLSLDYRAGYVWSKDSYIDVYADGFAVALHHIPGDGKGHAEFALPEGDKLLTVYFPTDCRFEIKNVTVNGSYKTVKEKGKRLLIVGDSITQGYGAFMSGATYVNAMQRRTGYHILSQGIGGYRYDPDGLMPVEGFTPDKILVALGTNYYNVMDYDYESDVIRFYERLHELYGNTPVLSVTPYYIAREDFDVERHAWCIGIIKRECAKYPNITVLDGYTVLPHLAEMFCDGLHPTAYGYSIIAEAVTRGLKELK